MQEMKIVCRDRWGKSLLCVVSLLAVLIIVSIATRESLCSPKAAKWTPQETNAWRAIQAGEIVNMEVAGSRYSPLDPNLPEGWNEAGQRAISPDFLKTILGNKEFTGAIPYQGIHIIGAHFTDPLNLSGVHIEHPLKFVKCRFEKEVDLNYITSSSEVSLWGCKFLKKCDIGGARIQAPLQIGSYSEGSGTPSVPTTFDGEFILQDARVSGYVYIKDVKFKDNVRMGRLQANTFLQIDGVKLEGTMPSAGTIPSERVMDLSGTNADYVNILGGNFASALKMDSIKVGENLVISHGAKLTAPVILTNSRIGGNLYIASSSIKSVDLSGSHIQGELLIGNDLDWQQDSGSLILDNTDIGILKCPMPDELNKLKKLSFAGCTYKRLNWLTKQDDPQDICCPWINKDNATKVIPTKLFEKNGGESASGSTAANRSYSAQPYEQLAGVLRAEGYANLANKVLFDKKEAERNSSSGLQWLLLTI